MACLSDTVIVFLLVGVTMSSSCLMLYVKLYGVEPFVGEPDSNLHTYRAGVLRRHDLSLDAYALLIQDAANADVDILLLPSSEDVSRSVQKYSFDEAVKIISTSAKANKIYVVTHLLENVRCQGKTEVIRSNLVFDRQGAVVSIYRKPEDPTAACNVTTVPTSFVTDFGVTFHVLMPEDLVLRNLDDGKNFVVAGEWESEVPVLTAPHFYKSWAYTTDANLVSSSGVFAGMAGQTDDGADFIVAHLTKDGGASVSNAPIITASPYTEDQSHYTIKPLDLAASSQGLHETVCHDQFCCHFYVKTSFSGSQSLNYGLAAFEGLRHFGGLQNIGTQECALLPCVDGNKLSCDIGSLNNIKVLFDEVSIIGNFKHKNSAQFPIVHSTNTLSNTQFQFNSKYDNNTSQVTIKLYDGENLLNFGIFGRDFSKDYVGKSVMYDNEGLTYKIYEYIINNEEVLGFVDYVWIRLRVLIFVVSIYVLEMM